VRVIPDDVHGAMAVWAEARGEPYEGKIAVANTIRERMRLKYASDGSVVGTVWRPAQFSWTLSTDPNRDRTLKVDDEDPSWQESVRAWAESAVRQVVPAGTVLYHAVGTFPYWAKAKSVKFVKQVGRHLFYTDEEA